jgi:ADP-ribose pyrophosphatase YjhB (NUDIX family)
VRRRDDGRWCLPGGWCEPGEAPAQTAEREVREETGLEVEAGELVGFFPRRAETFGEQAPALAIVLMCRAVGGELVTSTDETLDAGFCDYAAVKDWHLDHRERARAAFRAWLDRQQGQPAN